MIYNQLKMSRKLSQVFPVILDDETVLRLMFVFCRGYSRKSLTTKHLKPSLKCSKFQSIGVLLNTNSVHFHTFMLNTNIDCTDCHSNIF